MAHHRAARRVSVRPALGALTWMEARMTTIRRIYAYLLAGAGLAVGRALFGVLAGSFGALLEPGLGTPLSDAVRELPFLLVGAAVWIGHWRVAVADRLAVGEI